MVHIMDRLHDALAMVLGLNPVTQLQSLVNTGGSSARNRSTEEAEFGLQIDLAVSTMQEKLLQP